MQEYHRESPNLRIQKAIDKVVKFLFVLFLLLSGIRSIFSFCFPALFDPVCAWRPMGFPTGLGIDVLSPDWLAFSQSQMGDEDQICAK